MDLSRTFVCTLLLAALVSSWARADTPAQSTQARPDVTANPAQRDYRAHSNEYQLNDIRRRIETSAQQPLQAQPVTDPDFTGSPALLKRKRDADSAAASSNRALQSSLHRLSRDVREKATEPGREHLIEERLDRDH